MKATNIKDGKRVAVMHGENWFMPVESIKGTSKSMKQYIAGHSETGHHHVLESEVDFEVFEPTDGDRAVLLKDVTKLFHQKSFDVHETQFLAPGAYKIYHKTEYNPMTQHRQAIFD